MNKSLDMQDKKLKSVIDDIVIKDKELEVWYYLKDNQTPPYISVDRKHFEEWLSYNDLNWQDLNTTSIQLDAEELMNLNRDYTLEVMQRYLHEIFYSIINLKKS